MSFDSDGGGGAGGGAGGAGLNDSSDSLNLSFNYPWDSPMRRASSSDSKASLSHHHQQQQQQSFSGGDYSSQGNYVNGGKSPAARSQLKFSKSPLGMTPSSPPLDSPAPSYDVEDTSDLDDQLVQSPQNRIGSSQSTSDQEATESSALGHPHGSPPPPTTSGFMKNGGASPDVSPRKGSEGPVLWPETQSASGVRKSTLSLLLSSGGSGTHLNAENVTYYSGTPSPLTSTPRIGSPLEESADSIEPAQLRWDSENGTTSPQQLQPPISERKGMRRNRSSSAGSLTKKRGVSGSPPPLETAAGMLSALSAKTGRARRNSGTKRLSSNLEVEYNVEESNYSGKPVTLPSFPLFSPPDLRSFFV